MSGRWFAVPGLRRVDYVKAVAGLYPPVLPAKPLAVELAATGWRTDIESLDRWDYYYTTAKEAMIKHTDTDHGPWTSIKSSDKNRARINAMRFFVNQFDYEDKDPTVVYPADPLLVQRGQDSIKD